MPILLTDSKRGQVLDDVCAALRAMTIAGGYHWDVQATSVQTDSRDLGGVPHEQRPFFIAQPSPDGERVFEPANQLHERIRIRIAVVLDADGAGNQAKVAAGEAMTMDLEKALTQDIERGGLCSDTRVFVPEILVALGNSPTVFVELDIECSLHREYGAP